MPVGIKLMNPSRIAISLVMFSPIVSLAVELPPTPLAALRSQNFREREAGQAQLLAWSRQQPEAAMDELLKQSQGADDPEVRERCMTILRELVTDEYLKEGEGFIGIELRDEAQLVPGDDKVRSCIRVAQVQPDSPGHKAGLHRNDLIVGLNGEIWYDLEASTSFREKIMGSKPQTIVTLVVLREGAAIKIAVTLGRKPAAPTMMFFNGAALDPEGMERASREAYFRRWLKQKKLAK